jgi:geranylgeranyl diphosphate synthase type II
MFALAYEYLLRTEPDVLAEVLRLFNRTAKQVCEGQQFDMNYQSVDMISEKDYMNMIRLKTAVLIAASMKTGALIASADKQDATRIYSFGQNIGLAFQLMDDYLDLFGEEKFGKTIGGDIELSNETQAADLKGLYHSDEIPAEEKIHKVKEMYISIGVKKFIDLKINELYKEAMNCLNEIKVTENRKEILISYIDSLLKRDH